MLSLTVAPGVSAAPTCSYYVSGFRDDLTVEAGQVACGGDDVIGAIADGGTFRGGRGNGRDASDIVFGTFNGGDGIDTGIVVGGTFNGGNGDDIAPFVDSGTFNGGDGNDTVTSMNDPFGTGDRPVVNGGDGKDTVVTMTAGRFNGGDGKDVVVSYTGGTLISVP